ncbi:MAG: mannose-1-phosphate guanylyltransferase/mannose-6-phosphate isomerase, partial [Gammaproteobacteria bacterium]
MAVHPVILSGGAGSRLWPVSREYYPKPLLALAGERSLLQETATRLDGLADLGRTVLVCNEEHRFLVAEQMLEVGKQDTAILLEPEGRNTAPALTLAALYLLEEDPEAVMVVMPADHVIPDADAFRELAVQAVALAREGWLVTFGIVPERPETGYGYIRKGEALPGGEGFRVAEFVEKPDAETARRYLASGDYFWNSGIFVLQARRWIEELERYQPEMLAACRRAAEGGRRDSDFCRVDAEAFLACPEDSIDYAVMEKTDRAVVLPMAAGWSDVGAWQALWEISERDAQGNVIEGDVFTHDVKDSLIL